MSFKINTLFVPCGTYSLFLSAPKLNTWLGPFDVNISWRVCQLIFSINIFRAWNNYLWSAIINITYHNIFILSPKYFNNKKFHHQNVLLAISTINRSNNYYFKRFMYTEFKDSMIIIMKLLIIKHLNPSENIMWNNYKK